MNTRIKGVENNHSAIIQANILNLNVMYNPWTKSH